jgi:D-aminopeptidase
VNLPADRFTRIAGWDCRVPPRIAAAFTIDPELCAEFGVPVIFASGDGLYEK